MTEAQATDVLYEKPYAVRVRIVARLQRRIYKAARKGNQVKMMKLQRLLLTCNDAKMMAAITVCHRNDGKKSAGVDGIKNPTNKQILEIARSLSIESRPRPVKRTEIPKGDSGKTRVLGIPTLQDRANQFLVLLALNPQLEAEMVSRGIDVHGFRPGHSVHDALKALRGMVDKAEGKFVAECDIEKCFDRIDHETLLSKIDTWAGMKNYLRRLLKAGALEGRMQVNTDIGVPQGGPLSGLLANWALLGLEEHIWKGRQKRKCINGHQKEWRVHIVRYADDIRIVHWCREVLEECINQLDEFLCTIGLKLNREKTRIVNVQDGTAFLGFEIRQFATDPINKVSRNGFTTIIRPSKQSIKRHYVQLKSIISRHKAKTQHELIEALNPVIRGWSMYYSTENSYESFEKVDYLVQQMLKRWGYRRHANKSKSWVTQKYFNDGKPWCFRDRVSGATLLKHTETKIRPHVKMPKDKSVFDGLRKDTKVHPLVWKYKSEFADSSEVWAYLREGDDIAYSIEEPDDGKLSRPVLETSLVGDNRA